MNPITLPAQWDGLAPLRSPSLGGWDQDIATMKVGNKRTLIGVWTKK